MKRQHLVVLWILAASCVFAAGAEEPAAPTLEQIRNAYLRGIVEGKVVKLKNGTWEGAPFVRGGAERPRVELVEKLSATGNLDASPETERVVFLKESSGGSATNVVLAVFGMKGERAAILGSVVVGDRVQPTMLTIGGGLIFLDVLEAGPGDPACCPTHAVRKTYRLGNVGLEPVTGVSSMSAPRQSTGNPC